MPRVKKSQYYYSVDELDTERTGDMNLSGERNYTRRFRVVTKAKGMAALAVCCAPLLPRAGSPYVSGDGTEYDLLARLVSAEASQPEKDDWSVWVAVFHYSTNIPLAGIPENFGFPTGPGGAGSKGDGSSNNPELEPLDLKIGVETEQKAAPYDRTGVSYLNSARQPFTPAHTRPISYSVLTVTRNELLMDMAKPAEFANTVNSKLFMGYKPGWVFMYAPDVSMVNRGSLQYWRVTYRMKFWVPFDTVSIKDEDQGWQPLLLDQGLMQLDTVKVKQADGTFVNKEVAVPIKRLTVPITQPVCLDGKGRELYPEGQPDKLSLKPKYIKFKDFAEKDFNTLFKNGLGGLGK